MITYVACDLFLSPARVLVNTVNTVGVMGKGIAKRFKQVYPDMFERYQQLCEGDAFDIGELWLYKTPNKWVLNFPTKRHWRQRSRPEYVEQGLRKFVDTLSRSRNHLGFIPAAGMRQRGARLGDPGAAPDGAVPGTASDQRIRAPAARH